MSITYDDFLEINRNNFTTYKFPIELLAKILFEKLTENPKSNLECFCIENDNSYLVYRSQKIIPKLSDIFYSEHIWKDDSLKIHENFKTNKEFADRIKHFFTYSSDVKKKQDYKEIINRCDGTILDLSNTDIGNIDEISHLKDLKVLNLSNTKLEDDTDSILKTFPNLEIINDKFTEKWSEFALTGIYRNGTAETITKLDLRNKNIRVLKPECFVKFKNLHILDIRGNPCHYGNVKSFIPSLTSIYVDNPETLQGDYVFINGKDTNSGDTSSSIGDRIFEHVQHVANKWAICDEKCLSIRHSLDGNVDSMPIMFGDKSYFVFWPTKDIHPGNQITSNLFPQFEFVNDPDPESEAPTKELMSFTSKFKSTVIRKFPIKIFTDYPLFKENLHSTKFQLVDEYPDADLYWICSKQQSEFGPIYSNCRFINQIEGEKYMTCKDLLYLTCKEFVNPVPFLPETYIISDKNDLARFLRRHKELKEKGECHAFVVKCFNESRGSKMVITESAEEVLKHSTGSYRIAQRYMYDQLTLSGHKFDIRFIVILKSIRPFELFIYKTFWVRISPKRWSLEDFSDYERHFTVMNYRLPSKVSSMSHDEFINQFNAENSNTTWDAVLVKIHSVIRDMFMYCSHKMVQSPYTKGMYGVDIILNNMYQPFILESNFQPDCTRPCQSCPSFVDDVLEIMFVDQPVTNGSVVQLHSP